MSLPLEIDFSLGMRKYVVLITSEQGMLPKLHKGLGKYVLAGVESDARIGGSSERRFTHEIPAKEKGKNQKLTSSHAVELCSRPSDRNMGPD